MNDLSSIRRRSDDGLGPNSDIGNKLRALYGAVQDEGIPDKLLQLLDRLDEVEQQNKTGKGDAAYDKISEKKVKRLSKPLYMETTPSPDDLLESVQG